MSHDLGGCAVCGAFASTAAGMSRVVVEGRTLELCRAHVAPVLRSMPATFEDLRALFVGGGVSLDDAAPPAGVTERRSALSRRASEDRRVFPPRPEGRRASAGRRAGDLSDDPT